MGFFNGGRFNLTVSLRYVPQAGEIALVCAPSPGLNYETELVSDLVNSAGDRYSLRLAKEAGRDEG